MLNVPTGDDVYEIEVLDGELVDTAHLELERSGAGHPPMRAVQPAVQTAVAAATGFVAGAATMALLRRYGPARLEPAVSAHVLEPQRPAPVRTLVVLVRQLG